MTRTQFLFLIVAILTMSGTIVGAYYYTRWGIDEASASERQSNRLTEETRIGHNVTG